MTDKHHPERLELSGRLRELREAAGLSTTRLAAELGWSQSKVSKIENGRTKPAVSDVEAWLTAVSAPADERGRLLDMAECIQVASVIWDRSLIGGRAGHQRAIGRLLDKAAEVRYFHTSVVSGMMQTAEYARRVLGLGDPFHLGDTARAAAARIERQALLYEAGRRFEFLLTEGALRFRPGTRDVLLAQYDRILSVLTLPTVVLGIVPIAANASVYRSHGFIIYDVPDEGSFVTIETYTRELTLTDPQEVAVYQRVYESLPSHALPGEDARQFLLKLRDEVANARR